jgi:hypothetical protein
MASSHLLVAKKKLAQQPLIDGSIDQLVLSCHSSFQFSPSQFLRFARQTLIAY